MKNNVNATDFIASQALDQDWDQYPEIPTAICHTRAATQGTPHDADNNHPIIVGSTVGVHNGVIYNDYELFRTHDAWDRVGLVDSEAIFQYIAHAAPLGDPDNSHRLANITNLLTHVEGSMAIAWLDGRNQRPILHLARGAGSPLNLAITPAGSVLFASIRSAIADACKATGIPADDTLVFELEYGQAIAVEHGVIGALQDWEPTLGYTTTSSRSRTYHSSRSSTHRSYDEDTHAFDEQPDLGLEFATAHDVVAELEASELAKLERLFVTDLMTGDAEISDGTVERALTVTRRAEITEEMAAVGADITHPERRIEARMAWLYARNALTTIGDKVTTLLAGEERVAEVVTVPDAFGGGRFILRVRLPLNRRTDAHAHEYVLVQRYAPEFTHLDPPDKDTARLFAISIEEPPNAHQPDAADPETCAALAAGYYGFYG